MTLFTPTFDFMTYLLFSPHYDADIILLPEMFHYLLFHIIATFITPYIFRYICFRRYFRHYYYYAITTTLKIIITLFIIVLRHAIITLIFSPMPMLLFSCCQHYIRDDALLIRCCYILAIYMPLLILITLRYAS